MSALLLSQSLMSSMESSFREKSLQRHLGSGRHFYGNLSQNNSLAYQLQRQHVQQMIEERRAKEVPKFCWLVFVSTLVLVFYLFIFSMIALIGYLLLSWIPNDIERNKLNNELYGSIIDHSNILIIGQIPQMKKKFLMTKNLFVFESHINDDLMNFGQKPIILNSKYPALFWNEDFQRIVGNDRLRGSIWLDNLGQLVLTFLAPLNSTIVRKLSFETLTNHIRIENVKLESSDEWILPISSEDPGSELELRRQVSGGLKVFINQKDQDRQICIRDIPGVFGRIDLENSTAIENSECLTGTAELLPEFIAGFENGTSLHLITDEQKALIAPANVLYRQGKQYEYEMVPLERLIENGLLPVIGDYILIGVAVAFLLLIILTVLKYLIFDRRRRLHRSNDYRNHHHQDSETQPLMNYGHHHQQPDVRRKKTSVSAFSKILCCDSIDEDVESQQQHQHPQQQHRNSDKNDRNSGTNNENRTLKPPVIDQPLAKTSNTKPPSSSSSSSPSSKKYQKL